MADKDHELLNHKNLTCYKQLGLHPLKVAGSQVVCDCPFCGKSAKFYVNPITKRWDCKVCTREGGFKTFVEEMVKICTEAFKGMEAIAFAKSRGISVKVLKSHSIGYNIINKSYVLPIPDVTGKDIWDVRVYANKKLMSLSGYQVGLFGWDTCTKADTIWLCEGEWDKMALECILAKTSEKDFAVLAVPGAGTFKQEWYTIFSGKTVHVLYDHDEPGKKGANKVYAGIGQIAKHIDFIHWPDEKKDGYDVRDFKIETDDSEVSQLQALVSMLQPMPPAPKDGVIETAQSVELKDTYDGPYIPLDVQYAKYREWLHLPNTDVLSVLYGSVLANRLDGDPIWLFIVAPPGGTKTELLNSISDGPNIYTTSSLTPRSLVSGAITSGGVDPSLIPKLDQKVLIIKDFTTILDLNQMQRDEIFGILRDAYDGKTEKTFGNGTNRSYKSKFGIISGVTPAIWQYTEGNSSLGERFLHYNIPIPNGARERATYLERARGNAGRETQMREELAALGTSVLKHNFQCNVQASETVHRKTSALAQYVSKMRGTVVRDKFTHEITHDAYSELGTRLVKQFTKFMYGIAMYHAEAEITPKIYKMVKDMAVSTVPARNERIIRMIYSEPDRTYTSHEVAEEMKIAEAICSRLLENMDMLGMVRRDPSSTIMRPTWTVTDDGMYLVDEGAIYE